MKLNDGMKMIVGTIVIWITFGFIAPDTYLELFRRLYGLPPYAHAIFILLNGGVSYIIGSVVVNATATTA